MAKDAAAKPVKAYRIAGEVHEAVAAYAKARGTSAGVVMEEAARRFLASAEGGVPDLPVPDTAEVRAQRARAEELQRPSGQSSYAMLLAQRQVKLDRDKYGSR